MDAALDDFMMTFITFPRFICERSGVAIRSRELIVRGYYVYVKEMMEDCDSLQQLLNIQHELSVLSVCFILESFS